MNHNKIEAVLFEQRKEYQRYLGALSEDFTAQVKTVAEMVVGTQEQLFAVKEMVAKNTEDIEMIKIHVERNTENIAEIKIHIEKNTEDIAVIKEDVCVLKKDVTDIKDEMKHKVSIDAFRDLEKRVAMK